MAKGKEFDPIEDANELAQHNMNSYYWVNKVTSYTYARWMAEKKLAVIALPMYVVAWATIIWTFADAASTRHVSVWRLLFDFSRNDGSTLAMWVQALFMVFYTVVVFIMVLQLAFAPKQKPMSPEVTPKKKHQPKRRKDYH